jgi:2-isopropylmalate synthase
MDPASVGVPESRIVLGKHSGRHALKKRAEDLGFRLTGEELNEVYHQFTTIADNKKGLRNDEIMTLVEQVIGRRPGVESPAAQVTTAS